MNYETTSCPRCDRAECDNAGAYGGPVVAAIPFCDGDPVDWRARCLAAESRAVSWAARAAMLEKRLTALVHAVEDALDVQDAPGGEAPWTRADFAGYLEDANSALARAPAEGTVREVLEALLTDCASFVVGAVSSGVLPGKAIDDAVDMTAPRALHRLAALTAPAAEGEALKALEEAK